MLELHRFLDHTCMMLVNFYGILLICNMVLLYMYMTSCVIVGDWHVITSFIILYIYHFFYNIIYITSFVILYIHHFFYNIIYIYVYRHKNTISDFFLLVVDAWIARSHTSYSMVRHMCCKLQFTSSPSSEWSRIDIWLNLLGWSLRVFFVLGRFFYFHPQCQGRFRHLQFTWYASHEGQTP